MAEHLEFVASEPSALSTCTLEWTPTPPLRDENDSAAWVEKPAERIRTKDLPAVVHYVSTRLGFFGDMVVGEQAFASQQAPPTHTSPRARQSPAI